MGIKFPALVDNFSNKIEQTYTGWPDRLIDKNVRITYKSRPGPFGFHPHELKQALVRLP